MREQIAILMRDHGEWIFFADDEETERVFESVDAAMQVSRQDGWEIVEGPAPIRPSIDGLDRFELVGYRLKRRHKFHKSWHVQHDMVLKDVLAFINAKAS